MSFFGVKEWICEFFCPCCSSPTHQILKPFYNTFHFIYKVLCGTSEDFTSLAEMNFANHPLPELTTISATQAPNLLCKGNKCEIKDYFDIWLNETSSKVFSQTSRKKLFQTGSYSHWYDIFYYVKCWWTEVIKRLYSLTTCLSEMLWVNTEAPSDVIQEAITLFETKIEPSTEIKSFNNENSLYFLLLYCIIGGLCLITLLLNHRRVKFRRRKASLLSPSDIKEIEVNVIQKLIKFLKENKNIQEKLKNNFEENYVNFTNSIKSLEKKRRGNIDPNEQKNNLTRKYLLEEEQAKQKRFMQEQISKVEKQCKIYQNQIRVMEEQLHDLLENHRFEVNKYFTKYRRVELELGKTQNRLDLSHQLHKTETEHMQKYIAQLQAQYENINEFNIQRLTCRRSLQDYRDDPQSIEDVCREPQHNLRQNLNRSLSAIATPSAQDQSTGKFKTLGKYVFQNSEDNLKLPEESYIKPNLSPPIVQLQSQYINNSVVNTQEEDEDLQSTEEACILPTCNRRRVCKPSLVKLQGLCKHSTLSKEEYNFQDVQNGINIEEEDYIVLKCNCSDLRELLSGKMALQTQQERVNIFKPPEHKWSENNLQITEPGIQSKSMLNKDLSKPPSEKIQFKRGDELSKAQVKNWVLDSQEGLPLTGGACIKLKHNFNGVPKLLSKTPLQNQFKSTTTSVSQKNSESNLQLNEETFTNPKCNFRETALSEQLFQSDLQNSNNFETILDEYSLQNAEDDLHFTEVNCIEPKSNFARNANNLLLLSAPFQAQCENSTAFKESDDEDEYIIQDIEDDLRLPCEDCIKPGTKVLTTLSSFPATMQTQFNSTDEFSTLPKSIPDIQLSEEFNFKPKANFMPVLGKPSPVPAYLRTVNCGDLIDQSEQNLYIAESLKKIESIFEDTKELKEQVKDFKGSRNDEAYFRLKDILIQHAIKLNNIQCDGCTVLRKKSRQAWRFINTCRTFLESKTLK